MERNLKKIGPIFYNFIPCLRKSTLTLVMVCSLCEKITRYLLDVLGAFHVRLKNVVLISVQFGPKNVKLRMMQPLKTTSKTPSQLELVG